MTIAALASPPRERIAFVLAALVVVLFPLIGLPRDPDRAELRALDAYLYASDAALIALALLSLPRVVAAARDARRVEAALWVGLFGLLGLAFAFHPSARGIDVLLRVVAAAALYRTVVDASAARRRILVALLGLTAVGQSAVAVLQVVMRHPLGLEGLGEIGDPLQLYGGTPMARGTLGHEFILAALALTAGAVLISEGVRAMRPAAWLVASALGLIPTGLIYGRTVALSVVLAAASLVPAAVRASPYRWALAAIVMGSAVPAFAARDGWDASVGRGVSTDRGPLALQAVAIIADHPLVGVGPGNYLTVLATRSDLRTSREIQNVHDVPLMLAAEAGIPAGIVAVALLGLVGIRAFRAGAPAITVYLVYAPWSILDVLPYVTPQGLVLTALWLALLAPRTAGTASITLPVSSEHSAKKLRQVSPTSSM